MFEWPTVAMPEKRTLIIMHTTVFVAYQCLFSGPSVYEGFPAAGGRDVGLDSGCERRSTQSKDISVSLPPDARNILASAPLYFVESLMDYVLLCLMLPDFLRCPG